MNPEIIPGCSSYYNRKWSGVFYPEDLPSKDWFAYYCTHFKTFEINSTFYKFPTVKTLTTWYNKTPEDFLFAVKASKQITHINKFIGSELLLDEFYKIITEGLGHKLKCVLFQFPPSFDFSHERLELITKNLNPSFRNVVEFRNETWWNPEVFDQFQKHNIVFCNVDYPKLPVELVRTASTGYLRLHGNPRLFYSEYSKEHLLNLKFEVSNMANVSEFFIFFNNTAGPGGIKNAVEILNLIKLTE